MAKHTITMTQDFPAPRRTVFAQLTDHNSVGPIMGAKMQRIVDATGDNPNGLGSVRSVTVGPASFEETLTAFDPDSLMEYQITKGGPLKNHLGRMQFSDTDGGCHLDYTITFDARVPMTGGAIAKGLQAGISKGLAKYAASLR